MHKYEFKKNTNYNMDNDDMLLSALTVYLKNKSNKKKISRKRTHEQNPDSLSGKKAKLNSTEDNDTSSYENDDHDGHGQAPPNILQSLLGMNNDFVPNVTRKNNHIYFSDDVTMESVDLMIKMIHKIHEEFCAVKTNLATVNVSPKPIYLHITSDGGDLMAGWKAVNYIKHSSIPIHTVTEGVAASAAALMFVAGAKRYMLDKSYVLIHQLSRHGIGGTNEDIQGEAENCKTLMTDIINFLCEQSKGMLTIRKLRSVLKGNMLWRYDMCKQNGLADELYNCEGLYQEDIDEMKTSE
jgi:ATP-dependent protease ClpP protease subunit